MKPIITKKKAVSAKEKPASFSEAVIENFDPSNWFDRNVLMRQLGGAKKFGKIIGKSPVTVRRWMKAPGSDGAGEPSDFDKELMRRLNMGQKLEGLVSVD